MRRDTRRGRGRGRGLGVARASRRRRLRREGPRDEGFDPRAARRDAYAVGARRHVRDAGPGG